MKNYLRLGLSWGLPILGIIAMGVFRGHVHWSEWYALYVYPYIAGILSAISSLFPFSLGDSFIVIACLCLLFYPFYAWKSKKKFWHAAGKMIKFLMWIYIWFYLAWGINYFRLPFYERTHIEKAEYSPDEFKQFIGDYMVHLADAYHSAMDLRNMEWYTAGYVESNDLSDLSLEKGITEWYQNNSERFGLLRPSRVLYPKNMLWSSGMSRIGVTGYMGPFFCEFNLNTELLNIEYPFTYAHELAHRLGIAWEAEANLYAFMATVSSEITEVRFSGYFSLLGYVMNNARHLLTDAEYQEIVVKIPAEVLEMYKRHILYWREKYSPGVGKAQNQLYNAYLKSNKISSGTKNYSEVVGLLISLYHGK